MLSLTIFLPVIFALIILILKKEDFRLLAVIGSGLTFLLSLLLIPSFLTEGDGFKLVEKFMWIPNLNASYHIGLDGISLPLFVLASFLSFLVVIYHYNIQKQPANVFS